MPDSKEDEEYEKLDKIKKNHRTFSDVFAVKNLEEEESKFKKASP